MVGTITRGNLKRGDPVEIVGFGETIKTTATEIHIFNSPVNECSAGEHVGILARGIFQFINIGLIQWIVNWSN